MDLRAAGIYCFSPNQELNLSPTKEVSNKTPICIHFQNILTITVVIVLYSSYIGENIAAEAEAGVSPGNGSHRLLLWLTASRAAGIAARFGARCQQAAVHSASVFSVFFSSSWQQPFGASGNRSSVGTKPLANGTLHTPLVTLLRRLSSMY